MLVSFENGIYNTKEMLGIKTFVQNYLNYHKKQKLSSDWIIWRLMKHFQADELGHQANVGRADLGYGWIHYGLIRQQKPKNLLCIGSRHGYIPAIMAQACKDNDYGKVDFVDAGYGENDENHWSGKAYWKTKKGLDCFKNFGLEKFIKTHVKTTAAFKKSSPNKKYQYIYVDGNHSYDGARFDYETFWPNLEKGCFMLFHDISVKGKLPEGEYGVWKLFEDIKNDKNVNKINIDFEKSGLGILQKK